MTTEMTIEREEFEEVQEETNYLESIETVIGSLAVGHKVMTGQSEAGYAWKFKYGTVDVFVRLTGTTEDDIFSVWSPVLPLPAKNEEQMMRNLLEMNWEDTLEARFAIFDKQVVVLSSRSVADLNPGEISRSITIVATIADNMDEPLAETYGQG